MRALTAIHLTADNLLCVLDGQSAFALVHEYNENNHAQTNDEGSDCDNDTADLAAYQVSPERAYHGRQTGYDVREKDHGYTVADAVIVHTLSQPHYQGRTCAVASDHNDCSKHTVVGQHTLISQKHVVAERGDHAQTYGYVAGDLVDHLLAILALFCQSFQCRNSDCQKLHNDGRRDIGGYAECEKCCLRKCVTGQNVQVLEDGTFRHFGDFTEHCRIEVRDRNSYTDSVQDDDQESEENLLSEICQLPCIRESLKHFRSPRSFHQLPRSFP